MFVANPELRKAAFGYVRLNWFKSVSHFSDPLPQIWLPPTPIAHGAVGQDGLMTPTRGQGSRCSASSPFCPFPDRATENGFGPRIDASPTVKGRRLSTHPARSPAPAAPVVTRDGHRTNIAVTVMTKTLRVALSSGGRRRQTRQG
jgi:hypothetical protein